MRYQSLEDYIKTLSESEKKVYRQLIEEHRQREVKIRENFDELRKKLEWLCRNMEACAEAMLDLKKSLNELNASILEVHYKQFLNTGTFSESADCSWHLFQHYPSSYN